ncbi:MAG: cytochrome c biogenesis protein CcdA [Candidatus Micrarchaeaceae archaeon]|jgi:cytochrome c-type biogenesis protein
MKKEEVIFLNSVFFVIGFILIFAVLGILLQTFLTHVSFSVMNILKIIGGVIIIIFGVILILSAKYIIPFFSTEHRIATKRYSNSFASSFIFGIAFALGWTPCVGAILGSIYILAATSPGISFLLLLAYSLGLGIPFLVFGAFISKASNFFKKIHKFLKYFNIVGGLFLVAIGLLVITGYIGLLAVFLIGNQGAMSLSNQLNFAIAIVAGILTFFSPCILPILPAYFSYMAGTTAEQVSK